MKIGTYLLDKSVKMSAKEVYNDFKENYSKVRKYVDEDSEHDPDNDPYHSMYKAKDILEHMKQALEQLPEECQVPEIKRNAMLGAVLLNIGYINMETDDPSAGEKVLMTAEGLLEKNAKDPEIVITMLKIYNNLGILWSNRDEHEKAKLFLLKSKELYEDFKCTLQMPLSIENIANDVDENPNDQFVSLEVTHTLTLFYLAQLYGSLKQNLKSAIYCHITLKRQLQYNDYEQIDWALNSATLSQFFAEHNGFKQSRHHLAAASTMLDMHKQELDAATSDDEAHLAKVERFQHRSADVARCWSKYCLLLLSNSRQRLMNEDESQDLTTDMSNLMLEDENDFNMSSEDLANLIFPDMDVSKYENKVGCKFLLTYEDAREVFLYCQSWLNKAKEYYRIDTLASDHIELVQDASQCYSYLAFFEEDDERQAKMHKRRIDLLEDILKEVNPTYYLQYCRQLWYELGEVYSDILNIKLDKINKKNDKPSPSTLTKINMLCEKSIEHYNNFLNSVKNKSGEFPEKLDQDHIRPVISALAYIGRNSMKRISVDKQTKIMHMTQSYDNYKAVVDICDNDEEAATMMHEEYSLCQDMINFLPIKIKNLQSALLNQQ